MSDQRLRTALPEEALQWARYGVVTLFFGALSIIGLYGVGFAVDDYARARASQGWPVVSGVVLTPTAGHKLRYAYSVDGASFEGHRHQFYSRGWLGVKAVSFMPGSNVDVFADPENPQTTVLRPGGVGGVFAFTFLVFASVSFIGVGGALRTGAHAVRFAKDQFDPQFGRSEVEPQSPFDAPIERLMRERG